MLSNLYIEEILKHVNRFLGVFSSDNAIKMRKAGECLIINFDKQGEPGSHFVSLYMKSNNHCIYFDPLNLPIIPIEIYNYLSNRDFNITNCSLDIQSFESTYCGFYCMLFIICNKISFKYWVSTVKKFKSRSKKNDSKCIKYLCSAIKKYFSGK